jgi:hypothetical protein
VLKDGIGNEVVWKGVVGVWIRICEDVFGRMVASASVSAVAANSAFGIDQG